MMTAQGNDGTLLNKLCIVKNRNFLLNSFIEFLQL